MITDDTANVNKIRYSTDSFSAGSATIIPAINASTMPTPTAGKKLQ